MSFDGVENLLVQTRGHIAQLTDLVDTLEEVRTLQIAETEKADYLERCLLEIAQLVEFDAGGRRAPRGELWASDLVAKIKADVELRRAVTRVQQSREAQAQRNATITPNNTN